MDTNTITTFNSLIPVNCAPAEAKKVSITTANSKTKCIPVGELAFPTNTGSLLYTFAAYSDIHNGLDASVDVDGQGNPTWRSGSSDVNHRLTSWAHALKFIQEYNRPRNGNAKVSFVTLTGDITHARNDDTGSSGLLYPDYDNDYINAKTSEFTTYSTVVSNYANGLPIYAITGNHDAPASGSSMGNHYFDNTKFRQYLIRNDLTNMFNGPGSYEVTKGNDHLLFLCLYRQYSYHQTDLLWLERKLNEYKDERCFVFIHLFFPYASGNFQNKYELDGQLSREDLAVLSRLLKKFKNVVWFTGHSHWRFQYQSVAESNELAKWTKADEHSKYISEIKPDGGITLLNNQSNIYPISSNGRTQGWVIHNSSVAMARIASTEGNEHGTNVSGLSEGAIVEVYEKGILYKGVDFKNQKSNGYQDKFVAQACYWIPVTAGSASPTQLNEESDITPVGSAVITYSEDSTVKTNISSDALDNMTDDDAVVQIFHDGCVFLDAAGNEIYPDEEWIKYGIDAGNHITGESRFFNASGTRILKRSVTTTDGKVAFKIHISTNSTVKKIKYFNLRYKSLV